MTPDRRDGTRIKNPLMTKNNQTGGCQLVSRDFNRCNRRRPVRDRNGVNIQNLCLFVDFNNLFRFLTVENPKALREYACVSVITFALTVANPRA
jgi:hypothetical protein